MMSGHTISHSRDQHCDQCYFPVELSQLCQSMWLWPSNKKGKIKENDRYLPRHGGTDKYQMVYLQSYGDICDFLNGSVQLVIGRYTEGSPDRIHQK